MSQDSCFNQGKPAEKAETLPIMADNFTLKLEQATNPSGIKWKNMADTHDYRIFKCLRRQGYSIFMGIILLILLVICIFATQEVALMKYLSNPPNVYCPSVLNAYGADLKSLAFIEYLETRQNYFNIL